MKKKKKKKKATCYIALLYIRLQSGCYTSRWYCLYVYRSLYFLFLNRCTLFCLFIYIFFVFFVFWWWHDHLLSNGLFLTLFAPTHCNLMERSENSFSLIYLGSTKAKKLPRCVCVCAVGNRVLVIGIQGPWGVNWAVYAVTRLSQILHRGHNKSLCCVRAHLERIFFFSLAMAVIFVDCFPSFLPAPIHLCSFTFTDYVYTWIINAMESRNVVSSHV